MNGSSKYICIAMMAVLKAHLALATVHCDGLKDAQLDQERRWAADNISVTEELANFWSIHQRFGFVKNQGRILLIAKDAATSQQILKELGVTESPSSVAFEQVQGGVKTDVTSWIPELVRDIHAEPLQSDGPNCWNFCLRSLVTEGTLPMSAGEFNHWMDSPLAVEVRGSEPMRRGDVLVFRNPSSQAFKESLEVHGAMYWSPNVVIAKSAMGRYYPHRILDLREAVSFYYPNRAEEVRVFRMENLQQAAAKITSPTGPALRQIVAEALDLERASIPMFTGRKANGESFQTEDRFSLEDRYEAFANKLQTEVERNLGLLDKSHKDYEREAAIWIGIRFKSLTYQKISLFD